MITLYHLSFTLPTASITAGSWWDNRGESGEMGFIQADLGVPFCHVLLQNIVS